MRIERPAAVLASVALAMLMGTAVSTVAVAQNFEALIEDALRRQREGTEIVPSETDPMFTQPQAPSMQEQFPPPQQPAAPSLNPVELGPRPYTPPVLDEEDVETDGGASDAAPSSDGTEAPAAQEPTTATDTATETPTDTVPGTAGEAAPASDTEAMVGPGRMLDSLRPGEVNGATLSEEALAAGGANPLILKAEILLDRAGASPGEIGAYPDGDYTKAISAVETAIRRVANGRLTPEVWAALRGDATQDVLVQYIVTPQDVAYPFAGPIPADIAEQARMPSLAYADAQEMLAERFHMSPDLLRALNPGVDFSQPGSTIWVAAVETDTLSGVVTRVLVDKARGQVRAYDAENRLVVAYPASIGSAENPSPTGDHSVETVLPSPAYSYAPPGGGAPVTLASGPNNPVGSMWIQLSGQGYGIHGTADPASLDRQAAQGCVRLTNWDAEELAGLVQPGVVVSFVE